MVIVGSGRNVSIKATFPNDFITQSQHLTGNKYNMQVKALFFLCILSTLTFLNVHAGGGGGGHDHVKIIIPVHHKTIKHTHTIYKTIHHGKEDDGQDIALLLHAGGGGGHGKWF